jgi:hypothetical protein
VRTTACLALALSIASAAAAQEPPDPVAPEVITRNAARQATVRAIHLTERLVLDGRLDDAVYRQEKAISDFIQTLPGNNAEPSERTEAWVMFDDENVYVAARCWDAAPPNRWIANEMRRDQGQIRQNDHFGVMLDTFYDRRNGYVFYSNPIGGRMDLTEADEGNSNADWNPVWDVRTATFDGGWTIEMAIPFKSLRYGAGSEQVWGFNMRRTIRWKNEETFLTRVPRRGGANARGSIALVNSGATLVGISAPPGSRNLEVKPYALSSLNSDLLARPAVRDHVDGDVGFDVKYGITQNMTADFTYHTDFAQVEVDTQQVNLTRFSLFYP